MSEPIRHPDDDLSPRDVNEAIDAELEFHVESLRRDVERDGLTADEAVTEVRRRFGDPETYRRACWRVAMKEQIMKQRMQYIAMGVMLAIIIGLVLHSLVAHRRSLELRQVAEIERDRARAVQQYMMELLHAADTMEDAREVSIREVLDAAARSIPEWNVAENPEIEARIREAIERAKADLEDNSSDSSPDGVDA